MNPCGLPKPKNNIPKECHLLDVGAGDGSFLRFLNGHIRSGVGIDPLLTLPIEFNGCHLIPGYFPEDFVYGREFDVITLLAVIEHIPKDNLLVVADTCWKYLTPGGRVVITVPHPFVDRILDVLKFFKIINGLSLEEHYGFDPEDLPNIFNLWTLLKKERWQLGCNYLFVFTKP